MQTLWAVIQPPKLNAVLAALRAAAITRVTICDGQGYGRQRGQTALYRGYEYKTQLLRKVMLEIIVNDDFVERTVEIIEDVARTGPTGNIGDGKVFILPCIDVIEISSGTRGPQAI